MNKDETARLRTNIGKLKVDFFESQNSLSTKSVAALLTPDSFDAILSLVTAACQKAERAGRIQTLRNLYGPIAALTPVVSFDRDNEKIKWGDVVKIISNEIDALQQAQAADDGEV